ncbi:heat-shock protein HslJ, partial [Vibrio cholerae]|nr:heat-shock protein HslJ [Vibrio cholerae]
DWSQITLTKETLTLKNDVHTLTFTLRDWVK